MKTPSRLLRFTILFAMLVAALLGTNYTQAKNSPVDQPYAKGDTLVCEWGDYTLNANDANVMNGASATGTLNSVSILVCASNAPKEPNVPGTPAEGAQKVTLSPCPADVDGSTFELPISSAIERISKGNAVLAGNECPAVPPVIGDKTNNGNHFGTNKVKVTLCPSGETSGDVTIPQANNMIAQGKAVTLGASCPVPADVVADTDVTDPIIPVDTAGDPIIPAVVNIALPNDNWSTTTDEATGDVIILNPADNAPPGQQITPTTVIVVANPLPVTANACTTSAADKNKHCP